VALKEDIIHSFMAFEAGLNGQANTPVHKIRSAAFDRFEKLGFPTQKLEDWKYSSLLPITKRDYTFTPNSEIALEYRDVKKYLMHEIDSYRLVFLDGMFSSWLSKTPSSDFHIGCLCDGLEKNTPVVQKYFSKIAKDPADALTAVNTAFAVEGALVEIPDNVTVDKPIEIVYFSSQRGSDFMVQPRNLIVVGKNAEVQLIERHQSLGSENTTFSNSVTEIHADQDARVSLYKIQNDLSTSSLVDTTVVEQESRSNVSIGTFSLGGQFTRNNLTFTFKGEHAEANLSGISLLNDRQHVDHHTVVDHAVPNCQSNELYKGIFDEKSHGVFNGAVIVRKDAQKTNAFQQNDNVLLTDTATIDSKPQLEIYADDVKCSHGCTIGQLDQDALFYLKSRGIADREAKATLLYAFKHDVMETVKIEALRKRLNKSIAQKLNVEIDFEL